MNTNGDLDHLLLEMVLEHTKEAIIGISDAGRIVFCNRKFLDLTGHDSELSVRHRHVCKVLNLEAAGGAPDPCHTMLEALDCYSCLLMEDLKILSWDGRHVDIRLEWEPFKNSKSDIAAIVFITDLSIEKSKENEIIYLSYHDQLTGLFNRRYLIEALERMNNLHNMPIAVIMADMDGLKMMNDVFGHAVGDIYLQELSNILKVSLRSDDIAARIGGDEFVIVLPRTSKKEAEEIIRRIRKRCANRANLPIPLSVSFGLCMKDSTESTTQDILNHADEMMYKCKLRETQKFRHSALKVILEKLREDFPYEEEHAVQLQKLSVKLGALLDLDQSELDLLSEAAYFHDIGKIGMVKRNGDKTTPLTKRDREILKRHSEIGYRILGSSDKTKAYSEIILFHHEHWDGSGFPQGLKGDEIPLASQIILIADIFTRLTHKTPYHQTMSVEEAFDEIEKRNGTYFNPKLVAALKDILEL